MKFRELRADEIDCRIATVKSNGISLLLYKDARVDQNILDETVGAMNWSRHHETLDGRLYCTVSVYDKEKEIWISKQDVGTESYTEKEKGQASDSFKRACFNWGIGRELYTAPFIWIPSDKCDIKASGRKDNYGKDIYTSYDKFKVEQIICDDFKNIVAISIKNLTRNARVFSQDLRPKGK